MRRRRTVKPADRTRALQATALLDDLARIERRRRLAGRIESSAAAIAQWESATARLRESVTATAVAALGEADADELVELAKLDDEAARARFVERFGAWRFTAADLMAVTTRS